jgi:myosin-crossreactive antigen
LIYALRGVEENLLPHDHNQPPLSAYRVVNERGEAIDPDQSLFSQLNGGRLVNLVLTAQDVSGAEHQFVS